ncbi:TPA: amidohydrolase family protein [Kluyvera georgiana]|uniref:Putative 2-pyrone-4,6-dicarboxylic acid hydrolase n=1 Tax=Kluyvera georgiana ATCC 51603 TaxID=1354264 RepID=A0A1B7JFU0_9ENTR|nr:amidohydrolase family protein [Kluyvera georgiana]MDA8494788.1 amidohydrolase family protein [Kluyvera georgiana]OAT46757.1 putative 2-pyrone-4,6-dicarboxylic acid hydrolase [Kluyvera georgiana ATCC 51603]HDG1690935.1 amidohydrolase family protein [Kluyvera georgiana]HED1418212.1 amidohydrolase family protein [Kluyvera georgiana]
MLSRRQFLAASAALPLACALRPAFAALPSPLMIDSHVHVWKTDPRYPYAKDRKAPPQDFTAEMLLSLMAANGVARTVIVQVIHYRWDNRYLADVLRQYPDKFQGICRVNPEDPAAPEHLARLTTDEGFRGVRLSPSDKADGDWIRGSLMKPLWRQAADLKVPMTILAAPSRMPDLIPWIEQNPELTVVIDHMADSPLNHPDELNKLLALARYPQVYVKISHMWSLSQQSYPYPDAAQQVKQVFDAFGAQRLMWGTDWPICLNKLSYAQAVALYRDHLAWLTPKDREQILYKTVQQIWPFGIV